ncbi:unnamed protein product [Protopolystoma xenopodis]|uniref:Uncharacterized protein n=1 Tax=Protopolystoma xenopodis TaxID=117903 RepID=A0A3S5CD46_9PLAT|nr:unnamed protein product [Protopolystoma xenopodis]
MVIARRHFQVSRGTERTTVVNSRPPSSQTRDGAQNASLGPPARWATFAKSDSSGGPINAESRLQVSLHSPPPDNRLEAELSSLLGLIIFTGGDNKIGASVARKKVVKTSLE